MRLFSRPIRRLFFETKIFETETDTLKKFEISLDTEKSRDEMSHSDLNAVKVMESRPLLFVTNKIYLELFIIFLKMILIQFLILAEVECFFLSMSQGHC